MIDSVRCSETLQSMTLYRALCGRFGLRGGRRASMFNESGVFQGLRTRLQRLCVGRVLRGAEPLASRRAGRAVRSRGHACPRFLGTAATMNR